VIEKSARGILLSRILAACGLLVAAAAACRAAPDVSPTASTAAVEPPTASPSPAASPSILVDADLPAAVQQAAAAWATGEGIPVEVKALTDLAGDPPPGLAGIVSGEGRFLELPDDWRTADLAVVLLDPEFLAAGGRTSTLGPGVASGEAGFLAGAAAGLATGSGLVGFVPGMDSGEAEAYRSGFEEGLRYACPTCRVETVSDPGQPAFSMDVIGISPGVGLDGGEVGSNITWIVVFEDSPPDGWTERVAARVRMAPEAIVGPAMQALWEGDSGRAWDFAAATGSLVTEIDPQAISPGRERLLREAEASLREGWLVVGGG
jgi:hypothetical protein